MEQLISQIHKFATKEKQEYVHKAKTLHKEFLAKFPLERLQEMELEQYALGVHPQGSFSWWLEYNTIPLGSIKGGSANKHIIYYKKKDGEWFYPENFENEQVAWLQLRADILKTIEEMGKENYTPIDEGNLLNRGSMLRGKISYLYHADKLMPIYQEFHLKRFLKELGVDEELLKSRDTLLLNRLLRNEIYKYESLQQYDEVLLSNFLYTHFMQQEVVYKIAPGDNASNFQNCVTNSFISLGWGNLGDLTQYNDFNELKNAFTSKGYYNQNKSAITRKANEVWNFYNLQQGDQVIANNGTSQIVGIGTVNEEGYKYHPDFEKYPHTVGVTWETVYKQGLPIPPQNAWKTVTVAKVPKKQMDEWLQGKGTDVVVTEPFKGDSTFYEKIDSVLSRKGQIILYGPPGTGKTYSVMQFLKWKQQAGETHHYEMCTFHPSFQYEDFIEGFKPVAGENGTVSFTLQDGVFKQFINQAKNEPQKMFYFIIDELNRGNVPKIFGELITLLEKDKRGVQITLPQSKLPFIVPTNVAIIATMNTSDRSIKMMDAAIKRRFAFIECMPNYEVLERPIDKLSMSPAVILKALNNKLLHLQGRDLRIGHAYLMEQGEVVTSVAELKDIFQYDIIPLLQEYCFDNYSDLAEILGDSFVDIEAQEVDHTLFNDNDEAFIAALESHFQVIENEG
ncbi:AAA family ATPase [Psychrobacillus sp. FSL K6-1415]|uniref:AAA family ATPase n=1 Tax=Psychrobacillus sp. FSL K6-1415 TaxID=2921544 RepID=UPI0030F8827B